MADKKTAKTNSIITEDITQSSSGPLVFISHDTRDAEFAEAFSKLLKSISGGMLKSFRSSDKTGTEGIEFGDEWFKRLTEKLKEASDVVCIFTERSLERPWILYEAGVARGTLQTPVLGLALGVPLAKVGSGPFYHFQNSDDTEESLTKLVLQLARRVPGLEPDAEVVRTLVKTFKETEAKLLEKFAGKAVKEVRPTEENMMAKFLEEMKSLVREMPSRVAERVSEGGEPFRRRRIRRLHPMMLDEMMHMSGDPGDPLGLLILASTVRDDMPWLYEIMLEVYRALRSGDYGVVEREMMRLRRMSEMFMRGPLAEEMGMGGKDTHMMLMELPRMMDHMVRRCMEMKKLPRKKQSPKGEKNQAGE